MTILTRAKQSNQCRHLTAELDPYGDWYMCCELEEIASEAKCQKGLCNCDFFEGVVL
jgi:hypothetical protein